MKSKVLLLFVVLASVFVLSACGDDETETVLDDVVVPLNYEDKVLMDFLEGDVVGASMICFSSFPVMESELEVTTYIWNDKVRIEYMMIPPIQGQEDLYMVSDGAYAYVWGKSFLGNAMQGFKIAVNQEAMAVPDESMPELIDYDMPMIDCTPWESDSSYFNVPDDIEFMDMNALEESMMGLPGGGMEVDCSLCDQLPVDQRPSCLEGLGCETPA